MEPGFFAASLQLEAVDRAVYGPRVYEPALGIVEVHFDHGGMEAFHDSSDVEDLADPPRLRFLRALAPSGQVKVPYTIPLDGVRYYIIR